MGNGKGSGKASGNDESEGNAVEYFDPKEVPVLSRINIGARNPLVIARRLAGPGIKITGGITDKNINIFIHKAFANPKKDKDFSKYKFPDHKDLFDPKSGSPLYQGLLTITKELKNTALGDDPNKIENITRYETYKGHEIIIGPIKTIEQGEPPATCGGQTKDPNIKDAIGPKEFSYVTTSAYNGGFEFTDPVQGCIADCWLIAVLSSVAWAEQTAGFQKKLSRNANKPFFWPETAPGVRTKKIIETESSYYLDGTDSMPYYSRTNSWTGNPNKYESWGPCYEKACTGYWKQNRTPEFVKVTTPTDNDYALLNYKSAFGALTDITGLPFTINTIGYTNTYLTNPINDGVQIVEKLRTGICASLTFTLDEEFIGARKPAVAYTYLSSATVPALANKPYFPEDVAYNCIGMSANHVFSILGLYRKKVEGIFRYYIVLRNPWGFGGTTDAFDIDETHPADVKNGWTGGLKPAIDASTASNLGYINDYEGIGIFGLRSDYFMRYFEAFGWVPP